MYEIDKKGYQLYLILSLSILERSNASNDLILDSIYLEKLDLNNHKDMNYL